jgi:putative sugar O-methyltransferase
MTLYEIAQHFYARSQLARSSSHWEHLDQFGPQIFQETIWLDNFLSRWVSVGFNDTTMKIPDRFDKKMQAPLGLIELNQKCLKFDINQSSSVLSLLKEHFLKTDWLSYLGCTVGGPIYPVDITNNDNGLKVKSSFHELSLLYMGMRLSALTKAANLPEKLRILEIGGGYGGLFEKLVRLMKHQIDVVYLVDLPFNLTIQYWFVEACRKVGLHDLELIVNPNPGKKFRHAVVFVPIDDLEVIGELDLAINARSFGEMLPDDVKRYIDLIQDRMQTGGLFYNMNRYEKENSAGDVLRLKECPVDDKWSVLNAQLVLFFWGIGELALLRSSESNPTLRMSLAALPPYLLGHSQTAT